jgi:hypothetical protein
VRRRSSHRVFYALLLRFSVNDSNPVHSRTISALRIPNRNLQIVARRKLPSLYAVIPTKPADHDHRSVHSCNFYLTFPALRGK